MMDPCSSNASSVTSLDLEDEPDDVPEKPLSPVLSTSKTKRRKFFGKRTDKVAQAKVNLDSKFNKESTVQNANLQSVNHFKAVDMYEEQRRQYYDLLCDKKVEKVYYEKQNEFVKQGTSKRESPVRDKVYNQVHRESTETIINYQCNQNVKNVKFSTAGGRDIDISEESLQKGSEIFEDIMGLQDGEGLHDYSVLKNPTTTKKNLSKIPKLNQQTTKNVIKTKATRSTEIEINTNDIKFRQTQVDCFEDIIQNNSYNECNISETEDSTYSEEKYTNNLNNIFTNKKFGKGSTSSSEENEFLEAVHTYDFNTEKLINSNTNYKSNNIIKKQKRERSSSPLRNSQKQQEEIPQSVSLGPGDKVNIDAATSKNVVIVTMKPTLVELHRNKNFKDSNDSVENCLFKTDVSESPKKLSKVKNQPYEFLGFGKEEIKQSKKDSVKVTEVLKRTEEQFKDEKRKNEKKLKKIKNKNQEKSSMVGKSQKNEKYKSETGKNDDSVKKESVLNKLKSKKTNFNNNSHVSKNEDKQSVLSENSKKRKGTNEVVPVNSELPKNGNKTIELSPNQKKFKIEIDCNSKFRINISCSGESEASRNAIEAPKNDYKVTSPEIIHQDDKDESLSSVELHQPKGKLIKKFINKAQKLYRDIRKSDINLAEKQDEKPYQNENDIFKVPQIPNKISNNVKIKNPEFINESDYQQSSEFPKEFINYGGFKTAGGKELKCSEKSLKKAKEMYDGTYESQVSGNVKTKNPEFINESNYQQSSEFPKEFVNFGGFKTAGGKELKCSEKSLKKAKEMYDGTYESQVSNNVKIKNPEFINESNYQQSSEFPKEFVNFGGFKTAGGKELKCSEKSLKKAKEMYDGTYESQNISEIPQKENFGFKTAGGKNIHISEKALSKSKKLFENVDNFSEIHDNNQFGKDSNISENTLNKVEQLYDMLSNEKNNTNEKNLIEVENKNENQFSEQIVNKFTKSKPAFDMRNCGFASASGKSVIISEKAMSKATKMFESIEKETNENKINDENESPQDPFLQRNSTKITSHIQKLEVLNNNNNFNPEMGFRTGSGSKINISQKALDRGKAIFGDMSLQAGDFDSSNKKNTIYDTESLTAAQIYHQSSETRDFCMGDFIPSSENTTIDKTHLSEDEIKTNLNNTDSKTKTLGGKQSKKTFELLEDVVETVNNALQTIDNKMKRPRPSISRKRLGMARCKPINIPNEKLERAKLLFKDDLNMTVQNLKEVLKPVKVSQPTPSSSLHKQVSVVSTKTQDSLRNQSQATITGDTLTPSLLICDKTRGNVDEWFTMIDGKMEWLRMQLRELDEKKMYLSYQKDMLEKSKSDVISPQPGILIRRKEHVKLQLKDLKPKNSNPDDLSDMVLAINPQNAENIHFTFIRAYEDSMNVYTTLDGAMVVPNIHNIAGYSEIEMAFKTMPGVDLKLIPNGWVENHYKWIIWKLASYERFLGSHFNGCLNVENVIQQLKYRYDREIDRAERSALRKILEKDDIPQKRIVWCVSNIEKCNKNEIELTDGWYSIPALIDVRLVCEVNRRAIKVGTKIVTTGAQLLNCEGCHPLEASSNVKLRISYNSTRRAPWYSKLGYQRCPKPFLIPLLSIKPDGGMVGCIKIHVARMYPLRFMEEINGCKIWRNSKAEEKRAREFENERLTKMERVHYEVQKKYELQKIQERKNNYIETSKLSKSELLKITCPKTLLSMLESSNDPDALMEYLSPSQRASVLEYRQTSCMQMQHEVAKKITEEMEKLKLAKRKVVSILKLLVLDATCASDKAYQFCLWNPTEDDLILLKEYNVYYVYNVLPRYNGELFSTKTTFFKLDKKVSHNKYKRQAYPIDMLLDSHYRPPFSEYDTVGIVVYLVASDDEQSFWLADFSGNLLFVKVRDGPKFCRLLDDISKGDVVAVQNLIYSPPQDNFGVGIANQFTVITKSIQNHMRDCMEMFKSQLPQDLNKFLRECTAKIEKSSTRTNVQSKEINDISFLQCGFTNLDDDSSEENVIPQRLTPTDIAMSLIDTDQFI